MFDRTHVPISGRAGAGLGPQFVAQSCIACHVRNGRGRVIPDESLVRVVLQAGLGPQIQDKAVLGAEPEATVTVRDEQGYTVDLRVCGALIEQNGGWKVFSYVVDD